MQNDRAKKRPRARRDVATSIIDAKRAWMECLEARRLLAAVSWTNPAGGSWGTAGNWSTGVVPQPADDVTINQPGNVQITLAANASIHSLTLGGDTLTVSPAAQLSIAGAYTESAGASLLLPGGGSPLDPTSNQFANPISSRPPSPPTAPPRRRVGSRTAEFVPQQAVRLQRRASDPDQRAELGRLSEFQRDAGRLYTLSAYAMTPAGDPLTGSEEGSLQLIFLTSSGHADQRLFAAERGAGAVGGQRDGRAAGGDGRWAGMESRQHDRRRPGQRGERERALDRRRYNGQRPGGGSVYWDGAAVRAGGAGTVEDEPRPRSPIVARSPSGRPMPSPPAARLPNVNGFARRADWEALRRPGTYRIDRVRSVRPASPAR